MQPVFLRNSNLPLSENNYLKCISNLLDQILNVLLSYWGDCTWFDMKGLDRKGFSIGRISLFRKYEGLEGHGVFKKAKEIRYDELCNSFSRINNLYKSILCIQEFVSSIHTSRSLTLQFVPLIYTTPSLWSNSFPRFTQLVPSDCNSFPRFTQLISSDCNSQVPSIDAARSLWLQFISFDLHNSFPQIAIIPSIYSTCSLRLQFVPLIDTTRSLILQFVPSSYTTRSFVLQFVP